MNKKIVYICVIAVLVIIIASLVIVKKTNSSKTTEQSDQSTPIPSPTAPPTLDTNRELTEQEKAIFNSNFDYFKGEYVTSNQVMQLLATVKNSNDNEPLNKIEVVINGERTTLPNTINESNTYNIKFEYNKRGLINKITIDEN